MDIILWIVAILWTGFSVQRWFAMRQVPQLPTADASLADQPVPRVSVIVAARNEQQRIRGTVRRLLAQRQVDLELFVVNDRSDDDTANILRELEDEDSRLHVLHVEQLPTGWLGKPHACHLAASRANRDWLLFTDADVWMSPDLVARAIRTAQQERADHFCLMPREGTPSFWGAATLVLLSVAGSWMLAHVNRGSRRAFVGVGAFNLVRQAAYRSIDGHQRLRLELVDDMKLGLLLRRAGYRSRIHDANHDLEVHWSPTPAGLVQATEKNFFALLEFRTSLTAAWIVLSGAVWALALLGPLLAWLGATAGLAAGLAAGFGLATVIIPGLAASQRSNLSALAACCAPLAYPVVLAAMANSMCKTLWAGGVRWRSTFYGLPELKHGLVRWSWSLPRRDVAEPL